MKTELQKAKDLWNDYIGFQQAITQHLQDCEDEIITLHRILAFPSVRKNEIVKGFIMFKLKDLQSAIACHKKRMK